MITGHEGRFLKMTRQQMIDRYTDLARQRTEILLQTGNRWTPEHERRERAILEEMSVLETAIRIPVAEEVQVPEMITVREAAARTGLSYDYVRKLCLQGKIVFRTVGNKRLVNLGKLAEYLNGSEIGG